MELKEAATHFERAAALHPAPAGKADLTALADFWAALPARRMCEQ